MKKQILILMLAIACIVSCKKGDTGPAGATGANGTNGTNGTNGAANIKTKIVAVTPGSWNNPSAGLYDVGISMPDLTNVDSDAVMVYALVTTGVYASLPQSNWFAYGDSFIFTYLNQQVNLFYSYSSAPLNAVQIKIVVIPPSARLANPGINYRSYEQVKAAYNLTD